MASRHTIERLLDALEARIPLQGGERELRALDRLRFEQELEEVVQLAERDDAAHFRERVDIILCHRRH